MIDALASRNGVHRTSEKLDTQGSGMQSDCLHVVTKSSSWHSIDHSEDRDGAVPSAIPKFADTETLWHAASGLLRDQCDRDILRRCRSQWFSGT